MVSLKMHGAELARMELSDCRVAIMSDGQVLRNEGTGWKRWKRMKAGVDPVAYAAAALAKYQARSAEFHAYIRALVNASDLAHRGQLHALVALMPEDPDAVLAFMDDPRYEIRIEDVARCCRACLPMHVSAHAQE